MIKVLILALPLALAYLAWPVYSALEIREAIVAGDTQTLNRKIDWEALRASLKSSISAETIARLTADPDAPKPTLWQRMKAAVAPSMADSIVDRYVTPENLPILLGYRRMYRGTVRPALGLSEPPTALADTWLAGSALDRFASFWTRVRRAVFEFSHPLRARGRGQVSARTALRRHARAPGLGVEAHRPHRHRRRLLILTSDPAMRKLLILVSLPVLLAALGYAAWPAWSAWQLRAAVKARDMAAIERKVDWPTLRANLKRTIAANLKDDSKSPGAGFFTKAFKRTLGPLVTDTLIDAAVPPRTLAHVLAGRLLPSEIKREVAGGDASSQDPSEAKRSPRATRSRRGACAGPSSRARRAFASRSPIVGSRASAWSASSRCRARAGSSSTCTTARWRKLGPHA